MKLTILERVLLLGIIPREGNILDMNNAQNIKSVIKFSPEELDTLKIVQTASGMQWDAEAAIEIGDKEVVLGVSGAELIKKTLKKLSDEEKLPMDALSIYKKFVDGNLTVRDDEGKIVRDEEPEIISLAERQAKEKSQKRSLDGGSYGEKTVTAEIDEGLAIMMAPYEKRTNAEDLNQRIGGPAFAPDEE